MHGASSLSLRAPALAAKRLATLRSCNTSYFPSYAASEKQRQFDALLNFEGFYGGSVGGGKSDALLRTALKYVHVPYYSALILRRTYQDLALPGAIMDRAVQWLSRTAAKWNATRHRFTFPSGARLTFGQVEHDKDRFNYDSAEFQFIGFDELPHFTELQYTHILSRLRGPDDGPVPLRARGTGNPGGPGHEWVKRRFINPGHPTRPFIRARLEDNPGLDVAAYKRVLAALPDVQRRQLEEGDWDIASDGGKFRSEWFQHQIVHRRDVPTVGVRWVRYWDLASTAKVEGQKDPDWTAGALVGEKGGQYWIAHITRLQGNPPDVEERVRKTAERDGKAVHIYIEQLRTETGKAQVSHYSRNVVPGFTLYGAAISGDKVLRADPVASAAKNGNVKLVFGFWNQEFIDEAVAFPNGAHDDQVDAVSGAVHVIHPIPTEVGRGTGRGSAARDLGRML